MTKEEKISKLADIYRGINFLNKFKDGWFAYEGKEFDPFALGHIDHERMRIFVVEDLKKECEKIEKELKEIF